MLGNILLVACTSLVKCLLHAIHPRDCVYAAMRELSESGKERFILFVISKGIFFFIWEVYKICWTQLYMYLSPCQHGVGVYEECNTLYIATWLILPVIIRSSQRLSHACLSMNVILWNCEWLIISVLAYLIIPCYLDNRSNSRANTCVNAQPLEEQYLLDWNLPALRWFRRVIITFRIASTCSGDGSFGILPYQVWR